jgi:hypothetical protein
VFLTDEALDAINSSFRASNTLVFVAFVPEFVSPPLAGDYDEDGDVDIFDFDRFLSCFSGPDGRVNPPCRPGDIDGDGDIDWVDFALFQLSYTGAGT